MNMNEKQNKYEKLVKRVLDKYKGKQELRRVDVIIPDNVREILDRINLWSYWQGSLNAKIIIVGQDWGSVSDGQILDNIKRVKTEGREIDDSEMPLYFSGLSKKQISKTDLNLIEYLGYLGYKNGVSPEGDLFFTNLCLGYRTYGNSKNFKNAWLKDDSEFLKTLIEIIQPKVVICLGKATYQEVANGIYHQGVKEKDFYTNLDNNKNYVTINAGGKDVKIFGVAHAGNMGASNRIRFSNKVNKTEILKDDWSFVKKFL